jgi:NitT/TauT family transport system substrate-binding protein
MRDRREGWHRREFLGGLGLAGAAGLLGLRAEEAAAEPPPETTTIRLIHDPAIPVLCYAPLYVAEDLLRGEGFTEVRYVKLVEGSEAKALAAGQADVSGVLAATVILAIEGRQPLLALAGLHIGCLEVVGTGRVRTIRDLKGRTVAVAALGADDHVFLSGMLAYVGLDPRRDVKWVTPPAAEATRLLAEGKIDAVVAFPPFAQALRAQGIGRPIVRSTFDRPWSQYFCCMLAANRDFVRRHPVATKRVLRAVLKANQICAQEPARIARFLVERRYAANYEHALEALKEIPYGAWREYDPQSTLNFYALRLRDAGLIKSSPQTILAQGADWRFLNELKRELKA